MNCLVVLVAGLILSASPGNTLQCYSCLASTERCVGDTVNCPAGERCFLSVAEAAGVKGYRAGCAPMLNVISGQISQKSLSLSAVVILTCVTRVTKLNYLFCCSLLWSLSGLQYLCEASA
ncbi:uncharacterized protein LOC116990371 isoform X1 [Amblyraja radiata]|uniref:uncharacterized protein LOC116990371 isoform X1 n=1 Tax=Amblyraja radiata TaxID=386614 RepID=UPI0014036E60|nr:uncharacterized protein LOC116990371 isoform X1 [Amblyraja radiata]